LFLFACGSLDTANDQRFDRIARLSAQFYGASAAFIGFVDDRYQWMKSVHGSCITALGPEGAGSAGMLIARADAALCQAKQCGRDRAVVYATD